MTIDAPLGWHVILRLVDGRVIAPRIDHRRRLTRIVHRHGRGRLLLAYRLVGDHLHVLLACSREEAGKFAHAVEVALRKALRIPVAFEAARIRAVPDQRHLENAFRYILRQERRHGLDIDPTMDASSLADLWGLRALGDSMRELHRDLLPRVRIGREEVGFTRGELVAAPMALEHLADAAAAALGLTRIRGKGAERGAARAAAVKVGLAAGMTPATIAAALGQHASGVRRLRDAEVAPELVRAVELQLRIRGLLASARATARAAADGGAVEGAA